MTDNMPPGMQEYFDAEMELDASHGPTKLLLAAEYWKKRAKKAEQQTAELEKQKQAWAVETAALTVANKYFAEAQRQAHQRIEYLENAPCPNCGFPIGTTNL